MINIQKEFFSKEQCKANPRNLYVFGDNLIDKGTGGQAQIRYCKNSIGIPTKRLPTMNNDAFFNDQKDETEKVLFKLETLKKIGLYYDNIIFPKDGLGTGLAKMPEKSPKLFKLLCNFLYNEFNIKMTDKGFE